MSATNPMTGAQIRAIRLQHGWTQEELATMLGFTGKDRRQLVYRIEAGIDQIGYLRANLLWCIHELGYTPQWSEAPKKPLTQRQAEALWAARATGKATALHTTERGAGGGFRRMLKGMKDRCLLTETAEITKAGTRALEEYEATRKLKPKLKRQS